MEVNSTKDGKVHMDKNKLSPGNNGGHTLSILDSRLILVVKHCRRQANIIVAVYKCLKLANFNKSKVHLGCLNRFIVLMALCQ